LAGQNSYSFLAG